MKVLIGFVTKSDPWPEGKEEEGPAQIATAALALHLGVVYLFYTTLRFSYRGLPACALHADRSPHKFTPMPGVHKPIEATANKPLWFFSKAGCPSALFPWLAQ
jgi:hypothetical protein